MDLHVTISGRDAVWVEVQGDDSLASAVQEHLAREGLEQTWVTWAHHGVPLDRDILMCETQVEAGDVVVGTLDRRAASVARLQQLFPGYQLSQTYNDYIALLSSIQRNVRHSHHIANDELEELYVWTGEVGSPLHTAATSGDIPSCERWLRAGFDVDMTNRNGYTSLILAAGARQYETVDFLLRHGADADHANVFGNTALHFAAQCNHESVLEALLAASHNHEARNRAGETALHVACCQTHPKEQVVKLLLQTIDVNIKRCDGDTALLCYVGSQTVHYPIVSLLVEAGARPTETNRQGDNALHIYGTHSTPSEAIVALFETYGALRDHRYHLAHPRDFCKLYQALIGTFFLVSAAMMILIVWMVFW